jgi:uncharacterized phiE125 gp8 family phage protein
LPNSFKLERYTEAAQPAVSVCDLKFQVSVDDDFFNDALEAFGDAAQDYLESITGKVFGTSTFDLYIDCFPDIDFNFSHGPVTSITSISYLVAGVYTAIDTAIYTLGRGKIVKQGIVVNQGQTWPALVDTVPDAVRIRYIAGEENKRANQAIKLLVAHWFANREASGNSMQEVPFGVQAITRSLKTYTI